MSEATSRLTPPSPGGPSTGQPGGRRQALAFCYRGVVVPVGSFVRVTRDFLGDEPLVRGLVGKVVRDLYSAADPATEAVVVIAGARKPCTVPLEVVELIGEADYQEERASSTGLWKQRRMVWRERHGASPARAGARRQPGGPKLEIAEIMRRAEAVPPEELATLAGPALVAILTEWSVGGLDVLADDLPKFRTMTYHRARQVRTDHIERWLWDGVRLYLALRTFHPSMPPLAAEPARERVRSLFERIDEGEPAERLAAFSIDVGAIRDALTLLATHWMERALESFAHGLRPSDRAYDELAAYVLQLLIVGYQAGYCADAASHSATAA